MGRVRTVINPGGRGPPNLAALFPEFTESRVFVAIPGLLLTPPFNRDPPWISARSATIGLDSLTASTGADAAAARLAARLVGGELGGAFWLASPDAGLLKPRRVLVRGCRDREQTHARLNAALAGGPAARILLLLDRPDPIAAVAAGHGCGVLIGAANPWPLIDGAAALHAASDDPLAMLAQLAGIAVRTDLPPAAGGAASADLAVACLLGARYVNPFTSQPIDCAGALDIVAEWRRVTRANRAIGACAGMSFWKRRRMAAFFHDGERAPPHRASAAAAVRAAGARGVAAWSSRVPAGLFDMAAVAGAQVLRVEDGFVRSLGLGSGFLPPCSVIADATGIYYDPSRPSDLETLLRETRFDAGLLERARRLMDRLAREGITKYGAGGGPALPKLQNDGRRRILVPGQVADDLSVRLGGGGVGGNIDLLARVRAANPDAFVIYKPHPDVVAGHRDGAIPDKIALRHADLVISRAPIAQLIAAVDEVHTLTSLAGFEALLRAKDVVVYGQPFYAGWGLTRDLSPLLRRDRRLTLEELGAGVLLLYPRYLDPVSGMICTAEILLDRLADPSAWRPTGLMRLRRLQGLLRAALPRKI